MADDYTFEDLDEFFDDSLKLPIGGKDYYVPSPPGDIGLQVQRWFDALFKDSKNRTDADRQILADAEEKDLYAQVLGPVHAELIADGVTWGKIKHAALTSVFWIASGKHAAAKYWARPGKPETSPNSTKTSSTGAARKTRRRASTSGTSTRPDTSSDSPGGESSPAGA